MHVEQKDVKYGLDPQLQPPRLTPIFVAVLLKVIYIPAPRTSQSQKIKEAFNVLYWFFFLLQHGRIKHIAYCLFRLLD